MVIALDYALAVKSSTCRLNSKRSQNIEVTEKMLSKLTHLHLHGRKIDFVKDLSFCPNLQVLYLHDNHLTRIEHLEGLDKLRQLYFQYNSIKRIENLCSLKHLTKLYLNNNSIGVIEGLEKLPLEELHVANQILGAGEQLLFDSRTLISLSLTLQVLDITNNNLQTLSGLDCLQKLKILLASNNQLEDILKTTKILSHIEELEVVDLSVNPFCKNPHYKKILVTSLPNLERLDGKAVSETSKLFLQRLSDLKSEISVADAEELIHDPDLTVNNFTSSVTQKVEMCDEHIRRTSLVPVMKFSNVQSKEVNML